MLSRPEQATACKLLLVQDGERTNSWADRRPNWLMKAEGNRNGDRQPANRIVSARANACRASQVGVTVHARRLE